MEVINGIVSFLSNLSYSEIISYIIGIIGIVTSIITYLRSKRTQKPMFKKLSAIITEEMISKNSNVHIQNGDVKLDRLTITKVAFWNKGITLKKEEVSARSPFRIELEDENAIILEAYISYAEEENDVSCKIMDNKKQIVIDFDYLAQNQGFVVKVLHTGDGSKVLNVAGSMKNTGRLRRAEPIRHKIHSILFRLVPLRRIDQYFGYYFMFLGVILLCSSLYRYGSFVKAHMVQFKDVAMFMFLGIIVIIMGYFVQKGKMPEKVSKAFYDEM